jgi:AraC family transcriptional regulator
MHACRQAIGLLAREGFGLLATSAKKAMSAMPSTAPSIPHAHAAVRFATADCSVALLPAAAYEVHYNPAHHVIGFTFERQQGIGAFASDRRRPYGADPWRLALTPRGCDVYSSSPTGGEYLALCVAPMALARLAPEFDDSRLQQFTNRAAPAFTPVAMALRRRLMSRDVGDSLAIELSIAEAVAQVVEQIDGRAPARGLQHRMTAARLRSVFGYIEDNLHRDMRLAEIAGAISLSEAYVARSFKAATGITLHAALLERRVARARCLIADAKRASASANLADIAQATGFSSHAHMTTAFRRALGTTPSAWAGIDGRY